MASVQFQSLVNFLSNDAKATVNLFLSNPTQFNTSTIPSTNHSSIPSFSHLDIIDQYQDQPPSQRLETLENLAQFSLFNLQSSQVFPIAKRTLDLGLNDSDERVCSSALSTLEKIFNDSSPSLSIEVFLLLVSHLNTIFESSPNSKLVLKKFKLLTQFMIEIPLFWSRINCTLRQEIFSWVIRLLKARNQLYTSKSCIALCDPTSIWIKKWLHSSIARNDFIINMASILNEICVSFVLFVHDIQNNIASSRVEYITFLQSLSILVRLIGYSKTRSQFPIVLISKTQKQELVIRGMLGVDSQLTIQKTTEIVLRLITTSINDSTTQSTPHLQLSNYTSKLIQECLILNDFLLFWNHDCINFLIESIKETENEVALLNCFQIVSLIASIPIGLDFLMSNDLNIKVITKRIINLLSQSKLELIDSSTTLSQLLYTNYKCFNQTMNLYTVFESFLNSNQESTLILINRLINFAATPKGIVYLINSNNIDLYMKTLLTYIKNGVLVDKYRKIGYESILELVSCSTKGVMNIYTHGYFNDIFNFETDDSLLEYPVKLNLFCNVDSLIGILKYESESKSTGFNDIFTFKNAEMTTFNLTFISNCFNSLDSYILLESEFNILENVLKQQEEQIVETRDGIVYVIDQDSILRNNILLQNKCIGIDIVQDKVVHSKYLNTIHCNVVDVSNQFLNIQFDDINNVIRFVQDDGLFNNGSINLEASSQLISRIYSMKNTPAIESQCIYYTISKREHVAIEFILSYNMQVSNSKASRNGFVQICAHFSVDWFAFMLYIITENVQITFSLIHNLGKRDKFETYHEILELIYESDTFNKSKTNSISTCFIMSSISECFIKNLSFRSIVLFIVLRICDDRFTTVVGAKVLEVYIDKCYNGDFGYWIGDLDFTDLL